MSALPVYVCAAALVSAGMAGPASLEARLAPERKCLLAGSKTVVCAVLSLEAADSPEGSSPETVALSLVIDRSGSMKAAGKMEMVHIAGAELVDWLNSSDELGLVSYSTNVEVLRPMSLLTEPEGVKKIIQQLYPTSSTNLGGGLRTGIGLFDGREWGSVRRLLLLTDGLANRGETRPDVLARWAKEAFLKGTRVSAIGLGRHYNEKLLAEIAHAGGGEFYYVTERSQLKGLFRKELEEGRTVVVKDLSSTVRVSDGARFLETVGYPATGGDEKAREVKIGDLFAKETRSLLLRFELEPPMNAVGGTWRAAVVELAWTDGAGLERTKSLPVEFQVTYSETEVAESGDPDIRTRVIETENYRALDEAMDRFRRGDRKGALETIKKAEELIMNDEAAAGDRALIEQAGQLAQARRELEQRVDQSSVAKFNCQVSNLGYRGNKGWLGNAQLLRAGGSAETHSAVEKALRWLAENQKPDGRWDGGPAVTGLATLAFLGAGHTQSVGRYKANVKSALDWIISQEDADGLIGGGPGYDHAVCGLALAEDYGMTREKRVGEAAQKAVECSLKRRREGSPDTFVTGLFVMQLKSSKTAGLRVDGAGFEAAAEWLDKVTEKPGGRVSRQPGAEPTAAMTAVGMLSRELMGRKGTDPLLRAGAERLKKSLPRWEEPDFWYWYFGTLAMFHMGGDEWRKWNEAKNGALLPQQRKDGSWDPAGQERVRGGRVASTALGALCQEVYYRYLLMSR